MKKILPLLITAVPTTLALSGCFTYERRTPVVVTETTTTGVPVIVSERVVKTLPSGYRTRTHRGVTYYEYDNVYYRTGPRGYVVVERPW